MYFLKLSSDLSIVTPILGALAALFAVPFLISDKTLPHFLQSFSVTDYVFFEFFCIKRPSKMEAVQKVSPILSLLFGALLALVGMFYPVWWIMLAL